MDNPVKPGPALQMDQLTVVNRFTDLSQLKIGCCEPLSDFKVDGLKNNYPFQINVLLEEKVRYQEIETMQMFYMFMVFSFLTEARNCTVSREMIETFQMHSEGKFRFRIIV